MLIKIIVDNFKSFNHPTELNMIASNRLKDELGHKIELKNVQVLKNAVIYGANASGKSNLVEIFEFLRTALIDGISIESKYMFCKCDKKNINKESTFEIQFSVNDHIYDYGFSVLLNQSCVKQEWLYELKSTNFNCIFESNYQEIPKLGITNIDSKDRIRFDTYASDYVGNSDVLFLSELNRGKKYDKKSKLYVLKEVFDWLTKNIIVYKPRLPITNFEYFYDSSSLDVVNDLIRAFDTGISSARIENITTDELKNKLPPTLFEAVIERIKKGAGDKNKRTRFSMRSTDDFFSIEIGENQEPIITTIKLKHEKSFYDFDFEEESDGTRRIFDLLDMILIKENDIVFVVDELERSLHPKLTQHFLELFNQIHANRRIQLVFTTHESSIMDQSLFRRDEIWFIERNCDSTSKIYSLDRFKERYDKKLSKSYLEGRYGAIPIFKIYDFMEDKNGAF